MNNLEELKNLEEIQKAVDELKEKIINLKIQVTQEKEEDNKYKRERKKKDEQYYCLGNSGEIWYISDLNANEDIFGYSIGNYFETEEQAKNYKEKLLIEQELRDITRFEYIFIKLEDGSISFPAFKKGTMYKNIKAHKGYFLEELGL